MYKRYKTLVFPSLLEDPLLDTKDKTKIQELLKKPWNPYIRRHSALTEKSKILKEHTLRHMQVGHKLQTCIKSTSIIMATNQMNPF